MKRIRFFSPPTWLFAALALLSATWLGPAWGQPVAVQRVFNSPSEATNVLIQAAKSRDRQAMHQIFGPEVTNLLTGDQVLDARHFEEFAGDLSERCVIVPEGSDRATLEIGRESWPFPIPLVKTNGGWSFDTVAGEDEIIDRHIGRDEYYAIGVCRAYVKAQREYAAQSMRANGMTRYADRFKSSPGQQDGLYWPTAEGARPSPFSAVVAQAAWEGYRWHGGTGPRPFHGYCFKILTRQGASAPGGKKNYVTRAGLTEGFALVAYPVRWGESGIMTFIVNQDGVVYERSLGEDTAKIATGMKEYDPDNRWAVVQEPGIINLGQETPPAPATSMISPGTR